MNDQINYYDPSGCEPITIGVASLAIYALIAILALYVIGSAIYIESETLIIENSLTSLRNAIVDLREYTISNIKKLF